MPEYTTIQVRHDAELKVTITDYMGTRTSVIPAYQLGAHMAVASFMAGKYSNHPLPGKVSAKYKVLNGILADGELCDCERCDKEEQ